MGCTGSLSAGALPKSMMIETSINEPPQQLPDGASKQRPTSTCVGTMSISGEAAQLAHQPGTSPSDEVPNAADQHKLGYSAVTKGAMAQETVYVKRLRALPESLTNTAGIATMGQQPKVSPKGSPNAAKRILQSSLQPVRVASPLVEPIPSNSTVSAAPELCALHGGTEVCQHQQCAVQGFSNSRTMPQVSSSHPDGTMPVKCTGTGSTGSAATLFPHAESHVAHEDWY